MSYPKLAQQFDQHVALWLQDQAPSQFVLDGVDFELVFDGRYRVLCEGVEVAWNDNAKDFRTVGSFLLGDGVVNESLNELFEDAE